jgi:small subunit ribosomal protein S21
MPEVQVKKGEPINRALKRLKSKAGTETALKSSPARRNQEAPVEQVKRIMRAAAKRPARAKAHTMRDAASISTPLDRLFDPECGIFTRAAMERLAAHHPSAEQSARLHYLASRANEGELTVSEREEYETHIRLGKFISMMQLKARLMLRKVPAA